ncbi:hypothetical protein AAEO50_03555 [Rossellomorea oryzaecorticis]|uniref:Flagellar hook-length control protein-like C-terminal domain-containing protein n=1 Tax=Rossellomorea oryzaecorticis TaxID=1396505 RepID=A0ABU9K775_9BACI
MNEILGAYNSQASSQVKSNAFSLQNGRVLHISVHKLVGEGMAEVSSSGRKFIAKLDAPLEAGGHYWVRVHQNEDALSLSVIQKSSGEQNSKHVAQALIHQLHNQPADKVLINAVTQFINNKIPVTKELLHFASEHINTGNLKNRLPVLINMLKAHQPLSEKVLLSMEAGKGPETFSKLLNLLKDRLLASGSGKETLEIIKKIQDPLQSQTSKHMAVRAMENALNTSEPFSKRLGNFELLKSLGILPKGITFQGMQEGMKSSFSKGLLESGTTAKQLYTLLSTMKNITVQNDSKGHTSILEMNQIFSELAPEVSKRGPANSKSIEQVMKLIFEHSTVKGGTFLKVGGDLIDLMSSSRKQQLESSYSNLLSKWDAQLPLSNEGKIFNMLRADIDADLMTLLKGEDLGQALKTLIRRFGFNLESQLNSQPQIAAASTTLKERLTQLITHHSSTEISELAEKLVLKMNHTALVSWEQSSIMNIMHHFPLYLFGRHTDITVQWMGREKEKGKIDSDHCRILFYLQLGNLKETLVDMHVQNRIISLSIWNEHQIVNHYSQSLIPELKESLQRMNYQLSSVKIKKPENQDSISRKKMMDMQNVSYTGVDLKI